MSMKSVRFVLVTVSLLLAFTCIDRRSVFVDNLNGQLSTVSALLAIGCLQPPSSLDRRASSASLQLLHRYTSVLVGVALLGHHYAEADLLEVTTENFKRTSYYGSSVSLARDMNGNPAILITLPRKHADPPSITWRFQSSGFWNILLDRCDENTTQVWFEIADACKWQFVWDQRLDFKLLTATTRNTWVFPQDPPPPFKKLRIKIERDQDPATMSVEAVTDFGPKPLKDENGGLTVTLKSPYCMLDTTAEYFNVNMTLTTSKCPVNENAKLYYFYESTTTPSIKVTKDSDSTRPSPVWTGSGPAPSGYVTPPSISTTTADPGFPTWEIVVIAVGGVVLLALIVGGLIAFFVCRRRRRRQQEHFDDDVDNPKNIRKRIQEEEGLIEWTDLMAHAPYKPAIEKSEEYWPYAKGDTVDLSSITTSEHTKVKFTELQFKGDLKGTDDYGVVEGRFDPKENVANRVRQERRRPTSARG